MKVNINIVIKRKKASKIKSLAGRDDGKTQEKEQSWE